jgi:hypothetical protein
MNGDGRLDLVYTDGGTIFAVDPSGANLTGWPRDLNDGVYILPVKVSITGAPVTATNEDGAWVVAVTDAGIAYVFDSGGDLVPGYPRKAAGTFIEPMDLASGAGYTYCSWIDMLFNSADSGFGQYRPESGRARWHELPIGPFDMEYSWTSVYGGSDRDSWVQPSRGFESPLPQWADLESSFVIYPNPSTGERVAFHFAAPGEGEAKLDIMTLEGEKVLERTMALSGGEAEFTVKLSDRASGVYLCRLVVKSGGRTVETKKKFAIVN